MGLTALSLFAGIGGTAKGLRDIVGCSNIFMVEMWPTAVATLKANFTSEPSGHAVLEADVKTIDWSSWRTKGFSPTLLTGGPPCQPFSQATAGEGEYSDKDCIPDFIAAVRELQPKIFLMEEVWTLTWAKHKAYLERVLDDLAAAGYRVAYRVLRMDQYGIPQARKRLFVVGIRNDLQAYPKWPEKSPAPTMAAALGWDAYDVVRAAMLAPIPDPQKAEWVTQRPATTVVGSFRPEIQAAPGYRQKGDPSRQNAPGSVHITLEEALVLQGLPRDWKTVGNEAEKRLQIGNSCPPQMTSQIILANKAAWA